jgi:soluble lytic murein transglycosylase-like protein
MSIDAVVARVSEIEQLLRFGAAAPAPAAPSTSFAAELNTASTAVAPFASTAASGPSALPAGTPYASEITAAAQRHGIDPALLAGLVKQESGFNANAVSSAGARGLTQLMPATAAGLGVSDPTDPAQALDGGAKYLREQLDRFGGDVSKALAAYNAGPGAVERFGGIPPYAETQEYVRRVQANAEEFRAAGSRTIAAGALAAPNTAFGAAPAVSASPSDHGII